MLQMILFMHSRGKQHNRHNCMRGSTMTLSTRCIKNALDDCKWGLHLILLTIFHRSFISLEGRGPDGVHVCMFIYV